MSQASLELDTPTRAVRIVAEDINVTYTADLLLAPDPEVDTWSTLAWANGAPVHLGEIPSSGRAALETRATQVIAQLNRRGLVRPRARLRHWHHDTPEGVIIAQAAQRKAQEVTT